MTWLRRHLLLFVAVAVLLYMLLPNVVVADLLLQRPRGALQLHLDGVLHPGLDEPVWLRKGSATRWGSPFGSGSSPRSSRPSSAR